MSTRPRDVSPNRPIRVLALADHLGHPDGRVHGGTTYFLDTYPALQRAGVALTVCFQSRPHPAGDVLRERGVEPIFLGRAKWDPRAYGDVKRLVRQTRAEILHLASFKSHLIGRLLQPGTGVRTIVHVHDLFPPTGAVGWLQRRVAGRTDLAIGVSDAARRVAVDAYGIDAARTVTLHNGIDLRRFATLEDGDRARVRDGLGLGPGDYVVGMVGRFDPVKGHEDALRALSALQDGTTRLLLVGDGPTRAACESLAEGLGLRDAVRFTGQRSDVPDLLNAMDVLIMPSSAEGLGFAAIEAFAAGRPVVAYPVGGLGEIVAHGHNGLLVEERHFEALARALARLRDDRALRVALGKRAKESAGSFSIDGHVRGLIGLYEALLAAPRRDGGGSPP
ncbi:MAG: glycosyltransferase [Deferrisomatales bacterium]|nr:glycosyltransferase [Deferrisomatales bacterium]